ncbi:MAG: thiolase domain-containing protein, partial [Alphaproteobacteria bacterium]|nr:thiolase domain-containing protein [Alphaproteobacteria bacterium]
MSVCIVGWGHTKFGKLEDQELEALLVAAASEALDDAGVGAEDIDAIYVATFNAGMSEQDFISSLALQVDAAFRFTPSTRVENACGSGSAAVFQAANMIESGRARRVLAIGVEKMTHLSSADVGRCLSRASYMPEEGDAGLTFPGIFGVIAGQYFQQYGDQSDALAKIAAKNHANGAVNPLAHMQKDFGYEFCRAESDKNPIVAGPLKRTDCSMISDGAAAIVLCDDETAQSHDKAIAFRARAQANDFLPMSKRDVTAFDGPANAWKKGLAEAGLGLDDMSLVETHDCFTIAELIQYEAMGLTQTGKGAQALADGTVYKDGKLPINPSGGLKAKGHPVGATGVSMHVMAARQLMDDAGEMQVKDAKLAGVFNMGG